MIKPAPGRAASMVSILAVAGSAACNSSSRPQPRPSAGESNVQAEADLLPLGGSLSKAPYLGGHCLR